MRPHRLLAMLLALVPCAAAAQEYQAAFAFTAVSTRYDFTGPGGAPPTYQPPNKSATAPSFFGDAQIPLFRWQKFTLTGDLALRWPLGSDVGSIDFGAGVARMIRDGYVGLHYIKGSGVNATGVLDDDWDFGTEGFRAIARRGELRVDLTRLTREDRTSFLGGDDVRTFSRLGLAARYKMIGAEIERWRDDLQTASGGATVRDLNRLSVFVAIGQRDGGRGLW